MIRKAVVNSFIPDDFVILDDEICIYALYLDDDCQYVGQTTNLEQRLHNHLADGKNFNSVSYDLSPRNEANDAEAHAIVRFNPLLNRSLPKNDLYLNAGSFSRKTTKSILAKLSSEGVVAFSHKGNAGKTRAYISTDVANRITDTINNIDWGQFVAPGED